MRTNREQGESTYPMDDFGNYVGFLNLILGAPGWFNPYSMKLSNSANVTYFLKL